MGLILLLVALALSPLPVPAAEPGDWVAQKCTLYADAWTAVTAGRGAMSPSFVAANQRFIASHCTARDVACPVTAADLDAANALTLMLMNAGTASTFLPFRCPPADPSGGGYTGPGL